MLPPRRSQGQKGQSEKVIRCVRELSVSFLGLAHLSSQHLQHLALVCCVTDDNMKRLKYLPEHALDELGSVYGEVQAFLRLLDLKNLLQLTFIKAYFDFKIMKSLIKRVEDVRSRLLKVDPEVVQYSDDKAVLVREYVNLVLAIVHSDYDGDAAGAGAISRPTREEDLKDIRSTVYGAMAGYCDEPDTPGSPAAAAAVPTYGAATAASPAASMYLDQCERAACRQRLAALQVRFDAAMQRMRELRQLLERTHSGSDGDEKRAQLLDSMSIRLDPPDGGTGGKGKDGSGRYQSIGSGTFGTVYRHHRRDEGDIVAVKVLKSRDGRGATTADVEAMQTEAIQMRFSVHPNVITVLGVGQWGEGEGVVGRQAYIVMELAQFGSLWDVLKDPAVPSFPTSLLLSWLIDAASALVHIHRFAIKHRDIKAQNLLLFSGLGVKVTDFGLAKQDSAVVSGVTSTLGTKGSLVFMDPESRLHGGSSMFGDVYALAVTASQVFRRLSPVEPEGIHEDDVLQETCAAFLSLGNGGGGDNSALQRMNSPMVEANAGMGRRNSPMVRRNSKTGVAAAAAASAAATGASSAETASSATADITTNGLRTRFRVVLEGMLAPYRLGRLTSNGARDGLMLILKDLQGDPRRPQHPDSAAVQQINEQLSGIHAHNFTPAGDGGEDAAAARPVKVDLCATVDLSARVAAKFGQKHAAINYNEENAEFGISDEQHAEIGRLFARLDRQGRGFVEVTERLEQVCSEMLHVQLNIMRRVLGIASHQEVVERENGEEDLADVLDCSEFAAAVVMAVGVRWGGASIPEYVPEELVEALEKRGFITEPSCDPTPAPVPPVVTPGGAGRGGEEEPRPPKPRSASTSFVSGWSLESAITSATDALDDHLSGGGWDFVDPSVERGGDADVRGDVEVEMEAAKLLQSPHTDNYPPVIDVDNDVDLNLKSGLVVLKAVYEAMGGATWRHRGENWRQAIASGVGAVADSTQEEQVLAMAGGIHCERDADGSLCVTGLDLIGCLSEPCPLPPVVCALPRLESLRLSRNSIYGMLPRSIGHLGDSLTHLWLGHNKLTGCIPLELFNCRKLTVLDLSNNDFSGNVPRFVARLPDLVALYLSGNRRLTGPLPDALGELSHLRQCDLSRCRFGGSIPAALGKCGKLRELWLNDNNFEGTLPADLAQCSSLSLLHIHNNPLLTGGVPSEFTALASLRFACFLRGNHALRDAAGGSAMCELEGLRQAFPGVSQLS